MTIRVYARWPAQRVTDNTNTESRSVADFAFAELQRRCADGEPAVAGAVAIVMTEDGQQLSYLALRQSLDTPGGRDDA